MECMPVVKEFEGYARECVLLARLADSVELSVLDYLDVAGILSSRLCVPCSRINDVCYPSN